MKRKTTEQTRCLICGSLEKVETHHIDWHHENPDQKNRVKLCQQCHAIIHNKGYLSIDEMREIREKVISIRQEKGDIAEEVNKYYPKKLL